MQFGIGVINLGTIKTGGLLQGSGVMGISNYGLIDYESSAEGVNRILGSGRHAGIYNTGTLLGSRFGEILRGNGGLSFSGAHPVGLSILGKSILRMVMTGLLLEGLAA